MRFALQDGRDTLEALVDMRFSKEAARVIRSLPSRIFCATEVPRGLGFGTATELGGASDSSSSGPETMRRGNS